MANASPHAKPSPRKLDQLALTISLTAADSGLSRRGMGALHRLRLRQLETIERSRGAFVKIQPNTAPPLLDLGAIGAESPLTQDFHSLIVLELVADFPERGDELRALLTARRNGLDTSALARSLWTSEGGVEFAGVAAKHSLDPHLLAGTLWVALKPLYESVAAAVIKHFDPPAGGGECPVCGGPAWARCEGDLICAVCETQWECDISDRTFRTSDGPQASGVNRLYDSVSGQRLTELDGAFRATAFDPGPLIELLQLLDRPL